MSRQSSVSINDGDVFTMTELVDVSVVAPPLQPKPLGEAVKVELSNDGGFRNSKSFDLVEGKATLPWRLQSSRDGTFTKVVYVRFNNQNATVILTLSDDIILDNSKPVLAGVSVSAASLPSRSVKALGSTVVRANSIIRLAVRGSDSISGLAIVEIRSSTNVPLTTVPFSPSKSSPSSRAKTMTKMITIKTKSKKLRVRLLDRAGNASAWKVVVVSKRDG